MLLMLQYSVNKQKTRLVVFAIEYT